MESQEKRERNAIDNESRSIDNEHRMTRLESDINMILTNHLPHLQAAADNMERKLNWIIGLIITAILVGKVDVQTILALLK